MYQLEYREQARLTEYLNQRLEQFKQHEAILRFYGAERKMYQYTDAINQVLRELEGKNDNNTKLDNVFYLLPSIFFEDLSAIVKGEALPLPDSLLDIPPYLAELERLKKEAEEKRQAEVKAEEYRLLQEKWKQEAKERQKLKRARLADELGIDVEALEKLRGDGLGNGAIRP